MDNGVESSRTGLGSDPHRGACAIAVAGGFRSFRHSLADSGHRGNILFDGIQIGIDSKKESIDEYLDTAWTASAFRGIFLSALLFMTAPLVAEFFQTPEAVPVIQVIAATVLMNGFRNIGMVFFEEICYFINSLSTKLRRI